MDKSDSIRDEIKREDIEMDDPGQELEVDPEEELQDNPEEDPKEDLEEDLEEEDEEDDSHIKYDIASYPSDYTLSGLNEMWWNKDIEIPNYQREFVWTQKQASLLIDSFLTGLPVPPLFFYIDDSNKNLVIDGQQRLLSVVYFLEGYFGNESTQANRKVFRLQGLGEKSPYNNKRFSDLSESEQRKLKQAVLRTINIRQLSPGGESTSAYHIFERLNTGGTPLKPQEIRNVVFRGALNEAFKNGNKDPNWRTLLGKPFIDKHQKDVELLLRVYSLTGNPTDYEKPMKEHLNKAMKADIDFKSQQAQMFFKSFPAWTKKIVGSLGSKPFHLRGPLNIGALDSVLSVIFENFDDINFTILKTRYKQLRADAEFQEYTMYNTTDSKTVLARIEVVKHLELLYFGGHVEKT